MREVELFPYVLSFLLLTKITWAFFIAPPLSALPSRPLVRVLATPSQMSWHGRHPFQALVTRESVKTW